MEILKKLTFATVFIVSSLSAHSLWINSFESFTHKPGHAIVGVGWGHTMPVDDAVTKKIKLDSFNIINSDGEKITLNLPKIKQDKIHKDDSLKITNVDLAMQKVAFSDITETGTYSLELFTKPGYFTMYIDNNGKKRLKLKPKSEVKDVKKILFSMKHQGFAKSFFTVGEWSDPEPLGHALEIVPLTDLTNVKVGDFVEFDVLLNGKKISANPAKSEFMTATTISRGDANPLFAYIINGKSKVKVTHSGQWLLTVKNQEQKDTTLVNVATLTFNVK